MGPAPNIHLTILQTTSSSKPYVLLSRNLMWVASQHRYSKLQNILNSLNNIFQTIYPLEQKLDGRRQADRILRNAVIITFRYQRWPRTKQPSPYSSNKHLLSNHIFSWAETDWMLQADRILITAESFHPDVNGGPVLNSHHELLQTASFKSYVLLSRNLMGGARKKWRLRMAKAVPFRHQRWTSNSYWNSSNNICWFCS